MTDLEDALRAMSMTMAPISIRPFGPKTLSHPSIDNPCPACRVPFAEGDWTALIPLGPGDDEEAQERARTGRVYNAVAIEVHYACASGLEPREVLTGTPDLEKTMAQLDQQIATMRGLGVPTGALESARDQVHAAMRDGAQE